MLATQTQAGQHLRLKNGIEAFNTLEFHNNGIFNEKIQTVFTDRLPFVENWNHKLPLEAQF